MQSLGFVEQNVQFYGLTTWHKYDIARRKATVVSKNIGSDVLCKVCRFSMCGHFSHVSMEYWKTIIHIS